MSNLVSMQVSGLRLGQLLSNTSIRQSRLGQVHTLSAALGDRRLLWVGARHHCSASLTGFRPLEREWRTGMRLVPLVADSVRLQAFRGSRFGIRAPRSAWRKGTGAARYHLEHLGWPLAEQLLESVRSHR